MSALGDPWVDVAGMVFLALLLIRLFVHFSESEQAAIRSTNRICTALDLIHSRLAPKQYVITDRRAPDALEPHARTMDAESLPDPRVPKPYRPRKRRPARKRGA